MNYIKRFFLLKPLTSNVEFEKRQKQTKTRLCLQSFILTLGGLGEFSKVMQTLDYIRVLEFFHPSSCLDEAM